MKTGREDTMTKLMVWKGLRSWDGEDNDSSRIGEGREENNTNIRLEVE